MPQTPSIRPKSGQVEPRITVESIQKQANLFGEWDHVCRGKAGDRTIYIVVPGPLPVNIGDTLEYRPVYRSASRWAWAFIINGTRHLYVFDWE